MARCDSCGTTILFGGVRDGDLRFCNETCRGQGSLLLIARELPEELVERCLKQIHEGDCPKCGGRGPIDMHTSHLIWSALVLTSWRSKPEVCCGGCGAKARLLGALSCGLLGWWGVPWGVIGTPIQILRNLGGLVSNPDPERPSPQLERFVRMNLAAAAASQAHPAACEP